MSKRICVVTGGTGGIGYFVSEGFNKAGYKVVAIDKHQHKTMSVGIEFIKADLRSEPELHSAMQKVVGKFGAIHVLINNGAIANFHKSITEMTVEEFEDVMNVNLRGSFICSKEFVQANSGQTYGRIINMASTRWLQNEPDWEAYGASKGGLVSFTSSLAVSLAKTPITVNAVSPGWVQIDQYEGLTQEDHEQHPSGRVGLPRDIVNACLFLAHEENDFINGHNLVVDGGMTKRMFYKG